MFVMHGQTAGWTKMPLGMEVGLGPDNFLFDGDPAIPRKKGTSTPTQFLAHVYSAGWPSRWTLAHILVNIGNGIQQGGILSPWFVCTLHKRFAEVVTSKVGSSDVT